MVHFRPWAPEHVRITPLREKLATGLQNCGIAKTDDALCVVRSLQARCLR